MSDRSPHESPASNKLRGDKKRLLYLVTELYYFRSHKFDVAASAAQSGLDVVVAARRGNEAHVDHDFKFIDLNWKRSGSLLGAALQFFPELYRVRRVIKIVAPDILHNISLKPAIVGSLAALGTNTKVVNSINGFGFVFHDKSMLARIAQKFCGAVVRLSVRANDARIVLQNRDDEAFAHQYMDVPKTHLRLIAGSGVDVNKFTAGPEPEEEPFKFLILARLLYIKGIQVAVTAHSFLRERGLSQELVICGERDEGNPSAIPADEVARWSKIPGVTFAGQLEDVRSQISESHIVMHPALGGEGLPKALLEAAASGRAMIASDVSGNREVVIHEETGLLVKPNSPEVLADAMQRVMNHPLERSQWAKAARNKAVEEFSLTRVLDQHTALYREFQFANS
jgi:glycosyltransferase involved in cell wall biosynthesis